ncbi:MAG TPA: hydroxymethylbilane synthase [Dongiaceae bacterium]|jgi:hydroxymethylbilane synthase|nr:hydroxymethylbilane synthase [Dongiaceae bacterium]
MTGANEIRIGTRGSPLALRQAGLLRDALLARHPDMAVTIHPIVTTGDRVQDRSLVELGGKGLFVKEIEEALLAHHIDCAVHSLKDMPALGPDGLEIRAVLPRADPRDALIAPGFAALSDLPPGAVIGTSSVRRQAQLRMARPDCLFVPLRGNVETRLRKITAGIAQATVLAQAGLLRLELAERASAVFTAEEMLPAPSQGIIAVQARQGDARTGMLLDDIDDRDTAIVAAAERACLAVLEGSCRTPLAAYALREGDRIWLRGLIATPDGARYHRAEGRAASSEARALGEEIGRTLLAAGGPDFFRL